MPLVGWLIDKQGLVVSMFVLVISGKLKHTCTLVSLFIYDRRLIYLFISLAVASGIFELVDMIEVQIGAFIIIAFFRALLFSACSSYVAIM